MAREVEELSVTRAHLVKRLEEVEWETLRWRKQYKAAIEEERRVPQL